MAPETLPAVAGGSTTEMIGAGPEGSASAAPEGAPEGTREGSRRGRRRGRRGRRGGGGRDFAAGAGGAAAGVAAGELETDESLGSYDDGPTDDENSPTLEASGSAGADLSGAPGTTATDLHFDLPPAPVGNGTISWTGFAAPEPTAEASAAATAQMSPEPAPLASVEVPQAQPPALTPTEPVAAETPIEATSANEIDTSNAETTEKKVVWSSSPSERYTSFGSGTRRDDY